MESHSKKFGRARYEAIKKQYFCREKDKKLLFRNNIILDSWPAVFHMMEPRAQCQNHVNRRRNLWRSQIPAGHWAVKCP